MSMCVSHLNHALPTLPPCAPDVAGYVCDGGCNLRHPSVAELVAMEASHGARPRGADESASSQSICSPVESGKGEGSSSTTTSAPVCKFFVKGRCTKGSSCIFSHETPHEKEQPAWDQSATATVAPPRPDKIVATVTLRPRGADESASSPSICSPVEGGKGESSSTTTSSAPVCKFFVKGRCTKGSSCIFSHEMPHEKEQTAWDKSATATVAPPRPDKKVATVTLRPRGADESASSPSICSPVEGGKGESSSSTTSSAPVCNFFVEGRCTRGSSCMFSHETPHEKEQPAWDKSATATVAPPKPDKKVATVTLRPRGADESASSPSICSPVEGGKGESSSSTTASAPVCSFFVKGRCTRGSSCIFSHEMPHEKEQPALDKSATATVAPPRPDKKVATVTLRPRGADESASSPSICSPVESGKGESSSSTTASAPVCNCFVKGRCTKGSSCMFSHEMPHEKEQPAWDKSATATVAPPRPDKKVATVTLRTAAAKARAADTSETSVAASSDVKAKAVEILERHRWDEMGYCF